MWPRGADNSLRKAGDSSNFLPFFIIIVFGILLYLPTYTLEYVGDDNTRIFLNEFLRELNPLRAVTGQLSNRPLTLFTFWIEGKIFGFYPYISRSINVILHFLTSYMIFKLIFQRSRHKVLAFYLALIFFVHAINSQAIIISIQRGTILATFFILYSLYCTFTSRFVLMIFFYILGFFSKEFSLIFLFLLLYCLIKEKMLTLSKKAFYLILLLFSASFPLVHYFFSVEFSYLKKFTTLQFFTTQVLHFPTYIGKILYPFNLHYMYNFLPPDSFFEWKFFMSISVIVCFFSGIVVFMRYFNKQALIYLVFFIISLLPEFTFYAIPHLFFEHRFYFPLSFFLIFLGVVNPISRFGKKHHILFSCIVVYLSFATLYRSFEISTTEKWEQNVLKYPANDLIFHYEIIFFSIPDKDLSVSKNMLAKVKQYAPSDDKNLFLLTEILDYVKEKNKKNLEKVANIVIQEKNLSVIVRAFAMNYIGSEISQYSSKERWNYLMATLICPQLMYLELLESEFVSRCIANAGMFLQSPLKFKEEKEKLSKMIRQLVKYKRLILDPSFEKLLLKEEQAEEDKK